MKQHVQKKRLSSEEISYFCGEMSMILKSGLSPCEGIAILMEEDMAEKGHALLENIHQTLSETGSFYEAVRGCDSFPDYVLDMVDIGEKSGKLDDVMQNLSRYYLREDSIQKGIRSSITYPFVMIGLLLLIVVILVVKVLPIFNQVYIQLGSQLSGFSMVLMQAGTFLGQYYLLFIVLTAVLMCVLYYHSSKLRFSKKLQEKIAMERFARGMALTLSSGLDIGYSLELTEKLVDYVPLKEKIKKCRQFISDGSSFSHALKECKLFSGLYAHMLEVGIQTGNVDEIMQQAADQFSEEAGQHMSRLIAVLEPSMVAVLSIIVGIILLSVMLPLMGVMSGMAS